MSLMSYAQAQRRARYRMAATAAVVLALVAAFLGTTALRAGAAPTLLSQGKTATASSTENASFPASAAVDGNTGTRWSSAFSDPQWLEVDLGASASISQVVLQWEAAYATAFQIQTSADGTNWTTIYSTTTGTGGTQTLNVTGTGRYVRMNGTARGTPYGYSLWEFQVFGTAGAAAAPPTRHRGSRLLRPPWRTPASRPLMLSTATPVPAGPAPSATRSGCRSTSVRRCPSAR